MDTKEAQFFAELLSTFKIEAEEHLKKISDGLLFLEKNQTPSMEQEFIDIIFREAHSLKGAARAVNLDLVQNICQAFEDILADWRDGKIVPSKGLYNILYETIDIISKIISTSELKNKEALDHIIVKLKSAKENQLVTKIENKNGSEPISGIAEVSPSSINQSTPSPQEIKPEPPNVEKTELLSPKTKQYGELGDKTIRIHVHKLDKLLQHVEETLIIKLTSDQYVNDLKNIQQILKLWDKKISEIQSSVVNYRQSYKQGDIQKKTTISEQIFDFLDWQSRYNKLLKGHIDKLTRQAKQDNHITDGLVDNLLDETKKVLMQPFSTLIETFPRMVRDIATQLGKEVQFEVHGVEIEIDRRILEEIKDPLIHLVRNAIDHGIEKPEERKKAGKSGEGIIKLTVNQVGGNSIEVTMTDDGKGIDPEVIKKTAIKQGLSTEKELAHLSTHEILMLIFQTGFSTSPIITDLSGRGVGLGVVAENVQKLGGKIYLDSQIGIGTTFRITLPSTLATFRGIHISVESQKFIIPTHSVKQVLRIRPSEIKMVENCETIYTDGKILPLISLAQALDIPWQKKEKTNQRFLLVLILKISETTLAFQVDEVFKEQEVFVKGLGKQLERVKNISAATVLESGHVIPILNPFDLIKCINKEIWREKIIPSKETEAKIKTLLIAEDSVTARILLKNILESAGYHVKTSVDGADAYTALLSEPVDLLITDVEMPRLNGFQLTAKIRNTEKIKDIPIVICTSRGSKEDREHGIEVGANAYIDKSSFVQSNLLEIIKKLL
jgi:two-component system chemotaxis sensor kinase CheA